MKLAHIINPVKAAEGAELYRVQPVTFESIRQAKLFAQTLGIDIELYATGYEEDRSAYPPYFTALPNLKRSVNDLQNFTGKRKLPLIADILETLFCNTDAEWLIYSNADICLMPHFYYSIAEIINKGSDAVIIARRRVSKAYASVSELPFMYADLGCYHPGYDCFVFHRSMFQSLKLDHICIGIPFIEVSLLHNFIAYAKNLRHIDDMHLTFHIGLEVMPPIDQEYYKYNRNIYENKILPVLKPLLDLSKFPYASWPFRRRMLQWALNPCYRSALMLELEGKSFRRQFKMLIDELRWKFLSHPS